MFRETNIQQVESEVSFIQEVQKKLDQCELLKNMSRMDTGSYLVNLENGERIIVCKYYKPNKTGHTYAVDLSNPYFTEIEREFLSKFIQEIDRSDLVICLSENALIGVARSSNCKPICIQFWEG